ncbi:DNA repair protein RecN [uncultured Bifidobacterium sp.]|uniref:DNA repair protein RecN n=1 Tax=uncultured Bifidobacterium sp. TaxID=165187 RepID=UPI002629E690|nr:DNA repair protein RecN [uncultured Bifidobacterium sp.]
MLEELEVRGLGPIRDAVINPDSGMTAITGETGAGKSMLLDAIRLVSGGRVDSARLSTDGSTDCWAQAVFHVDDDSQARAEAEQAGVDIQDGELFLTRTVPSSGRSRAMLCGRTVPRAVLSKVASSLVVIHGQSDQLRIASSARQREFLDSVGVDPETLRSYADAWNAFRQVDEELSRLRGQQAESRQRADYLRDSLSRIDRVNPTAGEYEELRDRRTRIEHAAAIAQGVSGALSVLDPSQMDEDEPGVVDLMGRAVQSLRSIRMEKPFGELADRLEDVSREVSDVVFVLSDPGDAEDGEGDLDAINSRIHQIDDLIQRWGPTIEDVLAWRDRARLELEDVDASPERIERLEAQMHDAADRVKGAADRLSLERSRVAEALSSMVDGELESLAMAGSHLRISVAAREDPDDVDSTGHDDVGFLFTPYPGADELPLGSSASGGELSRLMLALELSAVSYRSTVEGRRSSSDGAYGSCTYIFDEIDAGVGGRAAAELGRRLARLAREEQVIVVTHLAQVASWADAQVVVRKGVDTSDGSTSTVVEPLDGDRRVSEVARMLSGDESDASLAHARELLSSSVLR